MKRMIANQTSIFLSNIFSYIGGKREIFLNKIMHIWQIVMMNNKPDHILNENQLIMAKNRVIRNLIYNMYKIVYNIVLI